MLFMSRLYPKNIAVRSVTDEHLLSVRGILSVHARPRKRGTSENEIIMALWIARRCFPELAPVDAAVFLLILQDLKLQAHKTPGEQTRFVILNIDCII